MTGYPDIDKQHYKGMVYIYLLASFDFLVIYFIAARLGSIGSELLFFILTHFISLIFLLLFVYNYIKYTNITIEDVSNNITIEDVRNDFLLEEVIEVENKIIKPIYNLTRALNF